ncbi:MAG: hypothetical protein U1E35_01835 [Rhodospirillales bacterium]
MTALHRAGSSGPDAAEGVELLPAELRKGDTYEVDEAVRNDGLINAYTLNSLRAVR